ncbi:hypothetical protein IAR55_004576 [Kwoniella newhampshirensis]|uniref:RING-type domain-containing protein n=1 Tax=Kwoniella newhampshirensis TaxID=1651941 RepID=A0AAW0YKJ9_9TREE
MASIQRPQTANALDLSHLGAELDSARRARLPPQAEAEEPISPAFTAPSLSPPSSTSSLDVDDNQMDGSASVAAKGVVGVEEKERPYPLCLLCLSRPPSAVLLPCCHLNLCYLCAPLLILKQRKSTPESSAVPLISDAILDPISPMRIPYNQLILRATANHPKSRQMALGGYRPPEEGICGGEIRGQDLVSPGPNRDKQPFGQRERRLGFCTFDEDDGRIGLGGDWGRSSGARCLMCRTDVKGWLRVYTG